MVGAAMSAALLAGVTSCCAAQRAAARRATEFWGFTGPWDPASDTSVRRHAAALDAVVTGWIGLDSLTARPILPSPYVDRFAAQRAEPARFAIVTSWHGTRFHPGSIRLLARDHRLLGRVASQIADEARRVGYRGLVLDFEDGQPADLGALVAVVKAISDSAHSRGVRSVAIAVPAADTDAYPSRPLLAATDLLLPMLYDQHWTTSPPGPISDPAWVRATLAARLAGVDPARIVAGLPTYAYRWPNGKAGEQISFDEATQIAARAGTSLNRDAPSQTLHANVQRQGDIWATDAALLHVLVTTVESLGVHRISLWRLGQEDPAVWRTVVTR